MAVTLFWIHKSIRQSNQNENKMAGLFFPFCFRKWQHEKGKHRRWADSLERGTAMCMENGAALSVCILCLSNSPLVEPRNLVQLIGYLKDKLYSENFLRIYIDRYTFLNFANPRNISILQWQSIHCGINAAFIVLDKLLMHQLVIWHASNCLFL